MHGRLDFSERASVETPGSAHPSVRLIAAGAQSDLWKFAAISLVIIVILLLQARAVVLREDWYWPFINYPMYASPKYEGDRIIVHYSLYGTTVDGEEIKIAPEDVDMHWFLFQRRVVGPLLASNADALSRFARYYRDRYGKEIVAFRLEDYPLVLTREGMKPAPPPQVLGKLRLESTID